MITPRTPCPLPEFNCIVYETLAWMFTLVFLETKRFKLYYTIGGLTSTSHGSINPKIRRGVQHSNRFSKWKWNSGRVCVAFWGLFRPEHRTPSQNLIVYYTKPWFEWSPLWSLKFSNRDREYLYLSRKYRDREYLFVFLKYRDREHPCLSLKYRDGEYLFVSPINESWKHKP